MGGGITMKRIPGLWWDIKEGVFLSKPKGERYTGPQALMHWGYIMMLTGALIYTAQVFVRVIILTLQKP